MKKNVIFPLIGILLALTTTCTKEGPITNVTDIDNNVYNVVKIGSQLWMQENLRVTRFRNGDVIGTTTPSTKNITDEVNPIYQWPANNNEGRVDSMGRIYTWYAVNDNRKICPVGWHLPTYAEWLSLAEYLGGTEIAGGKLKETGTVHWSEPNSEATNETGFNAVPCGYRNPNGTFWTERRYDVWWSSTATSAIKAYHFGVGYIYGYIYICEESKSQAVSVRCLKNLKHGTDIELN